MFYFFDISEKRPIVCAGFNYYPHPTPHPTRLLEVHDLIYMVEGEWDIRLGNERLHAQKNDVVILPAGIPHYDAGNCSAGAKTMFVHASLSAGDGRADGESPIMEKTANAVYTIKLNCLGNAADVPEIRELFQRTVLSSLRGDGRESSCYFDSLICALAALKTASDRKKELADRIKEMIVGSSGAAPLSNAEIARRLGIGVRTAATAFRAACGTSIHAFANGFRIGRARYYLESYPDMKICDIAAALGYYDGYHFSRAFRAACGLSPSAYRDSVFPRPPENAADGKAVPHDCSAPAANA